MTKRHLLISAMALFVLVGGGWAALKSGVVGTQAPQQTEIARILTVKTALLEKQESSLLRRRFTGQIVAARHERFEFPTGGRIGISGLRMKVRLFSRATYWPHSTHGDCLRTGNESVQN